MLCFILFKAQIKKLAGLEIKTIIMCMQLFSRVCVCLNNVISQLFIQISFDTYFYYIFNSENVYAYVCRSLSWYVAPALLHPPLVDLLLNLAQERLYVWRQLRQKAY